MLPATPPPSEIWLRDNARNAVVRATLISDFPSARLVEVETTWATWRSHNQTAEHAHWDWRDKLDPDILRWLYFIGIEFGDVQALMAVNTVPSSARLETGANIVYISYLETAPWNLVAFTEAPLYSGCGTQLIAAAIRRSIETGCNGRVGLHSLPQSEQFYAARCGMNRIGPDVEYDELVYFEFTPEQAAQFLQRVGLSG